MEVRIEKARTDNAEMEELLTDYLPFIKKQLAGTMNYSLEYDDMLSLAMLTFVNCVRQYRPGRGNFLSFCAACIHNRLVDEGRRQLVYSSKVVPLYTAADEQPAYTSEAGISIAAYNKEQERQALCQEISVFSGDLEGYGLSFRELARICPKQERSRRQCMELAKAVAGNKNFLDSLLRQRRLPQAELARSFDISPKTVEKHRKYIVALVILLLGDYPGIKAFLPRQ